MLVWKGKRYLFLGLFTIMCNFTMQLMKLTILHAYDHDHEHSVNSDEGSVVWSISSLIFVCMVLQCLHDWSLIPIEQSEVHWKFKKTAFFICISAIHNPCCIFLEQTVASRFRFSSKLLPFSMHSQLLRTTQNQQLAECLITALENQTNLLEVDFVGFTFTNFVCLPLQ